MDPEFVKIAVGVAVLIGGLALMLILLLGKGRKRAEQLAPAFELGTARPTGILGSALAGLYQGYSCRYQIQYPSQYDRGGAALQLAVTSPHQWTAEVEKPGARLLSKFRLIQDLEIGDRELDEHLRFAGKDEGSLRSLFGAESVLDAMHILAASENFESIHVHPEKVAIRWSPRMPQLDENADVLRSRLELVTALIAACGYPPTHTLPSL